MMNRFASLALAVAIAVMPASSPHWRFSYNSPARSSDFTDVTALSVRDIWAVGGVFPNDARNNRPLIKRWNGRSWMAVKLPGRYGNAAIDVVSASSARNVWVFGHHLTRTGTFAFALRWNGSSWSREGSWSTEDRVASAAVITPSNVWICGTFQFGTWHFNGSRWTQVKLPFVITAMSALSGNDIWASAWPDNHQVVDNFSAMLVRWRNGRWAVRSTAPSSILSTRVLALSDHDVWVAGEFEHGSGFEALALNWSAGKWHRYPFRGSVNSLNSIVPDGSGGLWAAFNTSQTVAHFSAGRWRDIRLPALPGSLPFVGALARVPRSGTTYAVGENYGRPSPSIHATILKYSR